MYDPAFNEILETARSRYEHVDSASHSFDLWFDGNTAIDRVDATIHRLGKRAELRGDLLGEFTGRGEDQRVREARLGSVYPRQDWNPESKGLAGTGGGAAHHVMATEQVGDCGCLDLEGGGDATPAQNRDN